MWTRLYKFSQFVLKFSLIVLSIYVLLNFAIWQTQYHQIWKVRLSKILEVHKHQEIYTNMVRSQVAWEHQADLLRAQLVNTHRRLIDTESKLKRSQYEYYHFLRVLEKNHPEVYKEIKDNFDKPRPFFFFPRDADAKRIPTISP